MAEEKKTEEAGGGGAPAKKTDVMLLVTLVFSLLNLAALGLGVFWTYKATLGWKSPVIVEEDLAEAAAQESEKLELQEPLIFTMDKFTVNLSGPPERMIRLEINVEMLTPDGFEEVMVPDNQARVKNSVIQILNGKRLEDIESLHGKLFLKDEIAKVVNKTLVRGIVKDVYFSEFVVQ